MKIHEYQGKKIFSDYDMPVQNGYTFDNIDKAEEVIKITINKDETVAIIGPTGSGKTTIINLLMNWYNIIEGSIYINGSNIKDIPVYELRTNIGVVLQDNFFISDTLMNNIKFFNNKLYLF